MGDLEEYEEGTQFCVGLARFLVPCTNRAGVNISAFKPLVFRDSFCSRLQSNLAGWHPTESGLSLRLPLYKQGWGLQSPEACAGCPISVPENIKVTIGYHIQNIPRRPHIFSKRASKNRARPPAVPGPTGRVDLRGHLENGRGSGMNSDPVQKCWQRSYYILSTAMLQTLLVSFFGLFSRKC